MANYKHMDQEERIEIQTGLKEGKSFKEIGIGLGRDASTVAKEIKGHLIVKETGTRSRPYKRDSTKVLLTLYFTEVQFMLAFLRDANTARSVTEIFNRLDNLLGREKFKQMFPVILTDRGSEFTDPLGVECDEDGEIRTRVFYCDPQRSNQKGGCEVTHEMIRRVLPKGTSFKDLTQEKVDLMMNHINSYTRKKLNDRSAHQLFSFLFGDDVAEKLHSQPIDADEINLTPELLK